MEALFTTRAIAPTRGSGEVVPVQPGTTLIDTVVSEGEKKGPARETTESQLAENTGSTSVQQLPLRWADVIGDPSAWRNLREIVVDDAEDLAA
jgi:hypothetical protein